MIALLLALLLVALLLALRFGGFSNQRLATHAGQGPAFDPRRHLSGPILCEGLLYGPFGRVAARFVAHMEGRWEGNQATLTEHFFYDSGRNQTRSWALTLADTRLVATAADIIGEGKGEIAGNAVRMRYRIRLAPEAGGHVLDVTDWMYLMENGTIMNRSQFRKFGIKVAELIATMRPMPAEVAR